MEETGERPAGETEGRSRGVGRMLIVFGLLLILYPLSAGPAAKLVEKGLLSGKMVAIFYAPLDMLSNRSELMARFRDWYLGDVWKIR